MEREQDLQSEPVENEQVANEQKVSESVVGADHPGQLNDTCLLYTSPSPRDS